MPQGGFEPPTPRSSAECSSGLSYRGILVSIYQNRFKKISFIFIMNTGVELSYELVPIRASRTDDFVVLMLELDNISNDKRLISLDVISHSDQISLDTYRVKKREEYKVGYMEKQTSKQLPVRLYLQRPTARPGIYDLSVIVYLHDRDFSSYIEKDEYKITVRVV